MKRSVIPVVAAFVAISSTLVSRSDSGEWEQDDERLSATDALLTTDEYPRLVIAGGGQLPERVYRRFSQLSGGPHGRIVVIPSAYPFTDLQEAEAFYAEVRGDSEHAIAILNADEQTPFNEETAFELLNTATGVWIGGGDQGRLADLFNETLVPELLREVLSRGGVVGGTSAGASILSGVMIRGGDSEWAYVDQGFDLAPGMIIDQHFTQRGRHIRLARLLRDFPESLGMGIDERTAAIIEGHRVEVIGEGRVWIGRLDASGEIKVLCDLSEGDEPVELPHDVFE